MLTNPFNSRSLALRCNRTGPVNGMFCDYPVIVVSLRGSTRRAPRHRPGRRRFAFGHTQGGLKGKMAPGDAHPYLALFYLVKFINEEPPLRIKRGGGFLRQLFSGGPEMSSPAVSVT